MANDTEHGLISYCGEYCGCCSLRLAGIENDERHLTPKAAQLDPGERAYWTSCPGCRNGDHRADCDFRICATAKGHGHCVQCGEFPCALHAEFDGDGVPHHAGSLARLRELKALGEVDWLDSQRKQWTCQCGAKLSWYLEQCLACGKPSPVCVTKKRCTE